MKQTQTAATVIKIRYCTQTEERKATGRRRSLNTNHCGVLAAGRRKGEAHLGNEVKGILSLCQILQGKMTKFYNLAQSVILCKLCAVVSH